MRRWDVLSTTGGPREIRRCHCAFFITSRTAAAPVWLKMKNLDAPAVKRETEEDWGGAGGELQSCAGNSSTIPRPAACYRAAKFFADAAIISGIA